MPTACSFVSCDFVGTEYLYTLDHASLLSETRLRTPTLACYGIYSNARLSAWREDDGVSVGPVGKQLWPRARMPAMTAVLTAPLKPQTQ